MVDGKVLEMFVQDLKENIVNELKENIEGITVAGSFAVGKISEKGS